MRETPEHTEREVYVERTGGGDNGLGALAIIVAIIAVVVIGWFVIQAVSSTDGDAGFPDEIDVNIDESGSNGG